MSDQPSPPPKPKPGSLRDRIAAFEKSSATPAPGPAPAPRPKPAGFSSWKPKPPSRPSTPPAVSTEQSPAAAASMSASDAKESITKGGSLKDRMAALQGKGAFGAPAPPVAAKPAVERPKWKPPPPVSAPADDDDHTAKEGSGGEIKAAVETSISPPVAHKPAELAGSSHSRKNSVEVSSTELPSGEHDDEIATADPEEEERQRRAALAARMARLGGARMGMAPPILGKKPPARKPTHEEKPAEEASKPTETEEHPQAATSSEPLVADNQSVVTQSPSISPSAVTSASPEDRRRSADYFASSKDSESASVLSSHSTDSQATKSPSSMPIPAVPRRAGPPRKKPVKPSAPPPEVPEEKLTDDIPALDTNSEKIDDATPISMDEEPSDETPKESEHIETETAEALRGQDHPVANQDTQVSPDATKAVEHAPTGEEIKHLSELSKDANHPPESPAAHLDTLSDVSPVAPTTGILPPPPSHVTEDISPEGVAAEDGGLASSSVTLLPSPSEAIPTLEAIAAAEEVDVGTPVAEVHDDDLDEEAEEEARKKRVAERLAKMGGLNPFAPQVPNVSSPPAPVHEAHLPEESMSPPLTTTTPVPKESRKHKSEANVEEEALDEVESDGSVYEPEPEATPADEHFSAVPMSKSPELPVPQSPPPLPGNRPSKRSSVVRQSSGNTYATDQVSRSHPSRQTSLASEPEEAPSPPSRQVQPPRRIVPQTPSASDDAGDHEDEHSEDEDNRPQSQRFVPPPHVEAHPRRRFIQDDDDAEGNGSENDSPALPVPHRRSVEIPPVRSIPPPPPADEYSETESDHDGQALPIPPRRVASPPTIVSSPPPVQKALGVETPIIHDHLTPTSLSVGREILDEEEGDPIDPNFHSPSRRTSFADISSATYNQSPPAPQSAPVRSPPTVPAQLPIRKFTDPSHPASSREKGDNQGSEHSPLVRKNTLADRMAKLGGIKFGAAPPVPGHHASQTSHPSTDDPHVEDAQPDNESTVEPTEEDEERARKERIAAKLANMGGMRIGMMPMGLGGLPPQRSHILREDPSSPPPPSRQTRPPPPAPELESESASVATSDDGVRVEAEESEAEEVSYQEAEPMDAPPVPSRMGRQSHRRESTEIPSSPPASRPPVPAAHRRSSVQSTTERAIPHRKESSQPQQSDYVMVEEGGNQEAPSLPPGRHGPRAPPHQAAPPGLAASQEMSSWEIPEFDTHTDLSLSWTDAGDSAPPSASASQHVPPPPAPAKPPPMDRTLTADDLIALWGRVGVQVCEVATTLFDKSKKTLVGDGTYNGFIRAVLADVPNAAAGGIDAGQYGYLIYAQSGSTVQKRASDIMPGDLVELHDTKLKGHKGLQAYQQTVGGPNESVVGIIGEFEAKKSKIRVFQANQHVGQQTVESVSYRLEDLKSGTVKIYRILEA